MTIDSKLVNYYNEMNLDDSFNSNLVYNNDNNEIINFRQPGYHFTDFSSAGINNIKEDLAVSKLNDERNDELSNNNLIRNLMQKNGLKYINTVNELNKISYDYDKVVPQRSNSRLNINQINNYDEKGNKFTLQLNQMRYDVPINYQTSVTSIQFVNPAYIINGELNLELMKKTFDHCLESEKLPNGLYCSKNNNNLVMPKNEKLCDNDKCVDGSINIPTSLRSLNISPQLKKLVQYDLYLLNKKIQDSDIKNDWKENYMETLKYRNEMIKNTSVEIKEFIASLVIVENKQKYYLLPHMLGEDVFVFNP